MAILVVGLGISSAQSTQVVQPSDVTPGERGICITEMDGGARVEIPLTILGTVGPATPEGEMVLVRLDDPRFEKTGIIAGMSGSPVYIGGKLLGALAFGWSFEREPIGGVTPFSRMGRIGDGASAGSAAGRPKISALLESWQGPNPGAAVLDWLVPKRSTSGAGPLPLAVTAAGSEPPVAWLSEAWRRMGWVAAPGGVAGSGAVPDGPLLPGDMVAGVLVDGDVELAVGGTVTEVEGSTVWAFGHPFLGGGAYRMALARARVVAVLPSLLSSFKFFNVGQVSGAFTQDRSHGMKGRLGATAPMVPVRVEVGGTNYRFRVIDHPALLPLMVSYVTASSQAVHGKTFGQQTLSCKVGVTWDGGRTISLAESFAEPDAPARAAALVSAVLAYLEATPFDHPALESVEVRLEQEERIHEMELLRVVPDRTTVHPGDKLKVRLWIRSHGEGTLQRTIELKIPSEARRDSIDVVVADGASWSQYELRTWPLAPRSFDDELKLLGRLRPSTKVVAVLEQKQQGVWLPGGTVAMPPSRALSLKGTLGGSLRTVGRMMVERRELDMPWPVVGAARVRLRVDGSREREAGGEP